jgi:hypothetical protein
MDMIVLRRFLGRGGRLLLMGESSGGLEEAGLEGAEVRGKGLLAAGAREVGTERPERKWMRVRSEIDEVKGDVEKVLTNSNPMLNRMEIRDVHGVRTESTYVFHLPISPTPPIDPPILPVPHSRLTFPFSSDLQHWELA